MAAANSTQQSLPGDDAAVYLIPFGPDANCTLSLCPVESSVFGYLPSIPANATLLGVFGVLLAVHVFQGVRYRLWGHMGCMVAGCILQIVGYAGRIILHGNPFDFNAFLMQIICITIAPVFYCAAVYVLLAKVINIFDPQLSRFRPALFYYLFIPADIVCLILQATGGALSATGADEAAVDQGVKVSKAGLILQVIVLVFFLAFFVDYLLAYRRTHGAQLIRQLGVFFLAIGGAVVLILVRCVYRIVELRDGYFAEGFRQQWEFVGLEGVVMCVAVALLAVGHPSIRLYPYEEKMKHQSLGVSEGLQEGFHEAKQGNGGD